MVILGIRYTGPGGLVDIDVDHHIDYQSNGLQKLSFSVPLEHPSYPHIKEELPVECQGQRYIVKSIDEQLVHSDFVAELDLDVLRQRVFAPAFVSTTLTLSDTLMLLLADTGWYAVGADLVSIKRSIELSDSTPYDVVMHCQSVYGVTYRFDTATKSITVLKPENEQPKNLYITDQLNLRRVDMKGDTYEMVTRLYPYGKPDEETGEAMNIASVNDGVPYIEDHTYSDKVISAVWRDERYTNPQSLKDDAILRLAKLAVPNRSYELDVADLAKIDPSYSGLAIGLHDKVKLIDRRRKTIEVHQVVAYREYPNAPESNVITLSTVPLTIEGEIRGSISALDEASIQTAGKVNEIKRDLDTTVSRVEQTYTRGETDELIGSKVTQSADVLRSEIAHTYITGTELKEVKSELEQSIEHIQLSMQKTGGDNLVFGSSARLGLEDWTTDGAVMCDTSTSVYNATSAGGAFVLADEVTHTGRLSQTIKTVPGGQYAWYFRYKLQAGLQTEATVHIGGSQLELPMSDQWVERTGNFTAQDITAKVEFWVQDGILTVADITVKEGLVCTAWQQAQNEIQAGGVTVTQRGLQVDANGDPFAVKIDNQQFLVRNKDTGQDVVYLTKDQALISRLTAQDELTVRRYGQPSKALRIIPVDTGAFFVVND